MSHAPLRTPTPHPHDPTHRPTHPPTLATRSPGGRGAAFWRPLPPPAHRHKGGGGGRQGSAGSRAGGAAGGRGHRRHRAGALYAGELLGWAGRAPWRRTRGVARRRGRPTHRPRRSSPLSFARATGPTPSTSTTRFCPRSRVRARGGGGGVVAGDTPPHTPARTPSARARRRAALPSRARARRQDHRRHRPLCHLGWVGGWVACVLPNSHPRPT